MGGSRRLRTWWKTVSWLSRSGRHSHPRSRPFSVPNRGQWQVSRTLACLSRRKRRSSRKSSGCCSSDVFGNLCPCLRSPAGVAVHSTLVATTVQRVRWQGLGRRGFSLESAAARVCREAGRRVTTNVRVQDMDLLPLRHLDNRRLEVVVDGLPLFRGAQLAIDTTMVSAVRSDGTARRQCATTSGAALDQARRRQERTCPELAQPHGRARLVVLGCEVGGRWSEESRQFLAGLAATKARSEPEVMRKSTMHSWLRRWSTLMACTTASSFALSLLERRCCTAADGPTPTTAEVVVDHFLDREGAVGFPSADS